MSPEAEVVLISDKSYGSLLQLMTIRFARLNATQPGNQFHEYRTKMLSKFVLNKQIGVKKCNVYHFGVASVLSCFFCSQNTDSYLTIKVDRVYVQIFRVYEFSKVLYDNARDRNTYKLCIKIHERMTFVFYLTNRIRFSLVCALIDNR